MAEQTADLSIEGMTCDHCVAAVTNALQGVAGVSIAQVSLPDNRATVTYDAAKVSAGDLSAAVEEAGYTARDGELPVPSPS